MRIYNISYLAIKYNSQSFGSKSSKAEQKFVRLRDKIDEDVSKLEEKESIAEWDFSVDSSAENLKKLKRETKRIHNYYSNNNEIYKKLKQFEKSGEIITKRLKGHLAYYIDKFNISKHSPKLKLIEKKEKETAQKLNSAERKINGKSITEAEINKILDTSTDVNLRENAFMAKSMAGDLVAGDIIELIKMRNDFAVKNGYNNFFEYEYNNQFEIPLLDLLRMTNGIYKKIEHKNNKNINDENEEFSKIFGIPTGELMRFHKSIIPQKPTTRIIQNFLSTTDRVIEIAKKSYAGMGFDIDYMPVIMDLLPRKNKDTGNFCLSVAPGKDIRVLANLTNSYDSFITLMHELGHAVQGAKNTSQLSFIDQLPSNTISESVALMMEDVARQEVLKKEIELNSPFVYEYDKDLKKSRLDSIISSLFDIEFEYGLYKNPYQDPKVLWKNLMSKYYHDGENEPLSNRWAINNLLIENPAYSPSYFLADIIKAQIYLALGKQFGPLTENPNVANYLNNKLFRYGSSVADNVLIKKISDEPLSEKAFLKSIE